MRNKWSRPSIFGELFNVPLSNFLVPTPPSSVSQTLKTLGRFCHHVAELSVLDINDMTRDKFGLWLDTTLSTTSYLDSFMNEGASFLKPSSMRNEADRLKRIVDWRIHQTTNQSSWLLLEKTRKALCAYRKRFNLKCMKVKHMKMLDSSHDEKWCTLDDLDQAVKLWSESAERREDLTRPEFLGLVAVQLCLESRPSRTSILEGILVDEFMKSDTLCLLNQKTGVKYGPTSLKCGQLTKVLLVEYSKIFYLDQKGVIWNDITKCIKAFCWKALKKELTLTTIRSIVATESKISLNDADHGAMVRGDNHSVATSKSYYEKLTADQVRARADASFKKLFKKESYKCLS